METKYEPIKFDSWQELAKYVIDGGEVYYDDVRLVFCFETSEFNYSFTEHVMNNLYTKKQPALEELIAIKPRLFWAWDISETEGVLKLIKDLKALRSLLNNWRNYRMLTDDEIKQFLSGE